MNNTWTTRDPDTGRHHRNLHLLELHGVMWKCLICGHVFDTAIDAELFHCGESCEGKHFGEKAV